MVDLMHFVYGEIQTENSVVGVRFCAYLYNTMEIWENNILQGKSSISYSLYR